MAAALQSAIGKTKREQKLSRKFMVCLLIGTPIEWYHGTAAWSTPAIKGKASDRR
jgi:hypothetical protein